MYYQVLFSHGLFMLCKLKNAVSCDTEFYGPVNLSRINIFVCCSFSLNDKVGDFSLLFVSFHFMYGTVLKIFIKHVRYSELIGKSSVKDVKLWHSQVNNSVVRCFPIHLIYIKTIVV